MTPPAPSGTQKRALSPGPGRYPVGGPPPGRPKRTRPAERAGRPAPVDSAPTWRSACERPHRHDRDVPPDDLRAGGRGDRPAARPDRGTAPPERPHGQPDGG